MEPLFPRRVLEGGFELMNESPKGRENKIFSYILCDDEEVVKEDRETPKLWQKMGLQPDEQRGKNSLTRSVLHANARLTHAERESWVQIIRTNNLLPRLLTNTL